MSHFPRMQKLNEYYQEKLLLDSSELPVFTQDVWPEFALSLLTDPRLGNTTMPAYQAIVRLYQQWSKGEKPEWGQWLRARNAIFGLPNRFHCVIGQTFIDAAAPACDTTTTVQAVHYLTGVAAQSHEKSDRLILRNHYDTLCTLSRPIPSSVAIDM